MILESEIPRVLASSVAEETQDAQAVVDNSHYDLSVGGQDRAVKEATSAHEVTAAVDVHDASQGALSGHVQRDVDRDCQAVLYHPARLLDLEHAVHGHFSGLVAHDVLEVLVLARHVPLEDRVAEFGRLLGVGHEGELGDELVVDADQLGPVQAARGVVEEAGGCRAAGSC